MPSVKSLVLSLAIASGVFAAVGAAAPPGTRVVYVSAVDKAGAPVTDLQASDVELKEGGRVQRIEIAPATTPLRIAMIDADWGTGNFQAGIGAFIETLLGRAEFALTSVLPQPIKITDYTSDVPTLIAGVNQLGPRGRQQGAQVLEAIHEAARTVRAEGKRPVIVVMRIGSDSISSMDGDSVREEVRRSGAILEAVSVGVQSMSAPVEVGPTPSTAWQTEVHGNEQRQSEFALSQVLGDGSRETGGRNELVISTTTAATLKSIAVELLHQYQITYTVPTGAKPGKLSVSTSRPGVTVRAPARPPD